MSWFYLLYFNLSLLTESTYVKVNFPWNFRCSPKEAVILLLSWSTFYMAFSNYVVSSFWFFFLDLPLFTQSVCIKRLIFMWIIFADFRLALVTPVRCLICLYSGNFSCSVKKAKVLLLYYFLHDPPCKLYFQDILCPKPCLLILNSQIPCPNLIFFISSLSV